MRCRSCGKRVSVSWRFVWALLPFLIGLMLAGHLKSPLGVAALVVGVIAMFLIHEFAVPIVGRDVPQRVGEFGHN